MTQCHSNWFKINCHFNNLSRNLFSLIYLSIIHYHSCNVYTHCNIHEIVSYYYNLLSLFLLINLQFIFLWYSFFSSSIIHLLIFYFGHMLCIEFLHSLSNILNKSNDKFLHLFLSSCTQLKLKTYFFMSLLYRCQINAQIHLIAHII